MPTNIENLLSLPHDTWGFLEWATGVLRVNATYDEFKRIDTLPFYERASYEETITHETFHRCQICTSGYLYNFTIGITKIIITIVFPYLQKLASEAKQKPRVAGNIYIGHDELWLPIAENPPRPPKILVSSLAEIDHASQEGISVRSLVEGTAYLAQKQIHVDHLTHDGYQTLLEYAPGSEYSAAYRLAESILGKSAFDIFQTVAFLALCFGEPHVVFPKLCKQFKLLQIDSLAGGNKEKIAKIIDELRGKHFFLGTTLDYIKNFPNNIHPYYKETLSQISKLSLDSNRSIIELMAKPENWLGDFRSVIGSLVILNPDELITINSGKNKQKLSSDEYINALNACFACLYSFALLKYNGLGFRYINLRK